MELLTKKQVAKILIDARNDPLRVIEKLLFIIDADGNLRPLKLNTHQRRVHAEVMKLVREGKPVRVIILKARQMGMSTYIQALAFTLLLTRPFMKALVLTHERELSQELAGKSGDFLRNMDARLRPSGDPSLNKIELGYIQCSDGIVQLDSRLTVDTSTGKESGRGKTHQFLHLSEYAFYPDPVRTRKALMPTVPRRPGTFVFIETTANGMGNDFHDTWIKAQRGDGTFVPIFLAWQEFEEYRATPPADFQATPDELAIARRYNLDDDQIYWRRITIADEFDGNEEAFLQEYPATPEEAFIHSGKPAFSKKVLIEYLAEAQAQPEPRRGYLEPGDPPRFHESDVGNILIHELPRADTEYIVGADTSLGVEDGDASAAAVFDRNRNRFAATWWGHIDPRRYGHELALLGYFYRTAIVAPETNNTGLTTLVELTHHLQYPNVFRWQKYDNLRQRLTDKLGWQTTQWSRPLLIDDMTYALRDHLIGIPSVQLCRELMIFDKGTVRVADDDLAIAGLIAWHCHLISSMEDGTMPRAILEKPKVAKAEDGMDLRSEREWKHVDAYLKSVGTQAASGDVAAVSDAAAWDETDMAAPDLYC